MQTAEPGSAATAIAVDIRGKSGPIEPKPSNLQTTRGFVASGTIDLRALHCRCADGATNLSYEQHETCRFLALGRSRNASRRH
jgi:hypothetical protein